MNEVIKEYLKKHLRLKIIVGNPAEHIKISLLIEGEVIDEDYIDNTDINYISGE